MKTKVVLNSLLPFKGFLAMCVWPFIFVRVEASQKISDVVINHESIHAEQQKEMLLAGIVLSAFSYIFIGLWAILLLPLFFWWYIVEWVFRIFQYRNSKLAYRNISFEREAYANEYNLGYLGSRRRFAWIHYLTNKK